MSSRAVQTNFRASDMVGSSKKSAPAKKAAASQTSEPEVTQVAGVPEGTIKEIQNWVGDDKSRAEEALAVENEKEKPRSSLVEWLEDVRDGDDDE
jgi:hypothetical protein